MRRLFLLATMTLMFGCAAEHSVKPDVAVQVASAKALEGRWTVDLRASPNDGPYSQPFVVEAVDETNRSLKGSFYDSEITWSRINTAWGKVVITFITSDGKGEYVHTATLQDGVLVGSSTAQHRNMLVPWKATRAPSF